MTIYSVRLNLAKSKKTRFEKALNTWYETVSNDATSGQITGNSGTVSTNNATKPQIGIKADSGKPDLSLIPAEFLIECGKSLTFGAKKYSAHNYRNGILCSRLLAAAQRHLTMEINGVATDPESGLSHLAHCLASLAMYSYMVKNKPDYDDRYKPTQEEVDTLNKLMYNTVKL